MTPEQHKQAQWGNLIVQSLGAKNSNIRVHPDKQELEQHLRTHCKQCDKEIPPGKIGRLCKACRKEE